MCVCMSGKWLVGWWSVWLCCVLWDIGANDKWICLRINVVLEIYFLDGADGTTVRVKKTCVARSGTILQRCGVALITRTRCRTALCVQCGLPCEWAQTQKVKVSKMFLALSVKFLRMSTFFELCADLRLGTILSSGRLCCEVLPRIRHHRSQSMCVCVFTVPLVHSGNLFNSEMASVFKTAQFIMSRLRVLFCFVFYALATGLGVARFLMLDFIFAFCEFV